MAKPLTEAEELQAAAKELGMNIPLERCQQSVRDQKASGLTHDEWWKRNLRRMLEEPNNEEEKTDEQSS